MNDSQYNELRAASWRRRLTSTEEAEMQTHLAAHPAAQVDWEEDLALTRQLQELPDAPLPSNFTARVLLAVEVEETTWQPSPHWLGIWWRGWSGRLVPRLALLGLVVASGLVGFSRYHDYARNQVARDVGKFLQVANIPGHGPGPQFFADFEAIQQLRAVSVSTDDDLLAALR
jgi:hypothetical protein